MNIREMMLSRPPETTVSLSCLNCHKQINTQIPQWEIDMVAENPESYIVVHCNQCDTTFSYIPSSASLVPGIIDCGGKEPKS